MSANSDRRSARTKQASAAIGVVAAGFLAVAVNVHVARHYRRFDVTTHRLYSLSPATVSTLRSLPERVEIDVLLSPDDALTASVRFLLEAYASETERLEVRWVDPDRHPAEFLALRQKYGIEAGKTEGGTIVTDAALVVSRASGGKPYFVAASQLVDFGEGENDRARSRVEQALTTALRVALDDERPKVCFTVGHREVRLDDGGPAGLAELASRLRKNNYEAVPVETNATAGERALEGCRVVAIVAPSEPFAADETQRLAAYVAKGGGLFVAANPVPDGERERLLPLGLTALTSTFGIVLDEDFVFEQAGGYRLPSGFGERFLAQAKPHAITAGLVGEGARDLKILASAARSVSRASGGAIVPSELLATSAEAFGVVDFFGAMKKGTAPEAGPGDRRGPLALAMAAELPRPAGASDGHGARAVVAGTSSFALGQSFQERVLRGGAVFAESAIAWIAARPPIVDVPDKPATTGARIAEESLGEVFRYSLLYMPAAAALLALAVHLRRRSTEGDASKTARDEA